MQIYPWCYYTICLAKVNNLFQINLQFEIYNLKYKSVLGVDNQEILIRVRYLLVGISRPFVKRAGHSISKLNQRFRGNW